MIIDASETATIVTTAGELSSSSRTDGHQVEYDSDD
jgi:hypothetical protein